MYDPYLSSLTDEQLAQLSLKDSGVYEIIIERYSKPLSSFLFTRFIHDSEQVSDIVQETFIKAYLSLSSFDPTRKWKTWLYKISINLCFSYLKKPQTLTLEENFDFTNSDSPDVLAEKLIRKEKVDKAILSLEGNYRAVVTMYYKEELSLEEISKTMSLKVPQVKIILERANKLLALSYLT